MAETTEKTLAEELREAAAKVRRLAKAAPPGPWGINGPWWWDGASQPATSCIVTGSNEPVAVLPPPYNRHPDAEHAGPWIQTMSPLLAEPLASWLEETADEAERHEAQGMGNSQDEIIHGPCLAVARALNGTAS